MRSPPITVSYGNHVLFRQFADGNVIMPLDNAERAVVADTLREILGLVDGELRQPSFSKESGFDGDWLRIAPNPSDHMSDADAHRTGRLDSQNSHSSSQRLHSLQNDN